MSLPTELRVLCFQLSSTPVVDLPRLTPTLMRHVLHCQVPLSTPLASSTKADAPASSVLVHKLKTQLSSLLNGKSEEGRFTAVVLIKAVVEVGGWEVLNGSELWVRGLLAVLANSNSIVLKELCIIALTKIYVMTLPYQTLLREITTPTLPAYLMSCLNLVVGKGHVPVSLKDAVFRSFAILLPRHSTTFRPFASQIRSITGPYVAPTSSDGVFVPSSLKESARQLMVISHQTAAKNSGGEEWAKAVRELVKEIHVTADGVFRAVVEDWESTAGYIGTAVDVDQELHGGAKTKDDLLPWQGIYAGVERLIGLLELLEEYISCKTSTPVALPLGSVTDVINRILSIPIPSSETSKGYGGARLHPAVDREEREALWTSMPQIYVAAFRLTRSTAEVLGDGFVSIAQGNFDQLCWVFPSGKHSSEFRMIAYQVATNILQRIGLSLDKSQASKLNTIIRTCCQDLSHGSNFESSDSNESSEKRPAQGHVSNHNADTFLPRKGIVSDTESRYTDLSLAARELLPLLLSHIPQHYLDISLRALIERTAILASHKDAMLASILNPFIGKNGKALPTIMPHLNREFSDDDVVEILLRPRMPLLPSTSARLMPNDAVVEASDDEIMDYDNDSGPAQEGVTDGITPVLEDTNAPESSIRAGSPPKVTRPSISSSTKDATTSNSRHGAALANNSMAEMPLSSSTKEFLAYNDQLNAVKQDPPLSGPDADVVMSQAEDTSDDESVHLTMQLDTDSESEMEEDSH